MFVWYKPIRITDMNTHNFLPKDVFISKIAVRILAVLFLAGSVLGCSVQGEITDLTKRTMVPKLGQQMGFVSGANQNETVSGYKISSSVGHWSRGGKGEEVNGYKVYTTVQGNLTAETMVEIYGQ